MNGQPKHIVIDARNRGDSGVGRYSDRLLVHLQLLDASSRYTVLVNPEDDWQPSADNFSRVVSPYKQFSFNPLEQIGFARQLYGLKADLVHFTMTQHPLLYFGPLIVTTHDLTMLRFVRPGRTVLPVFWAKRLGYRLLFWSAHRKARIILVPSKYVKKDLAQLHPLVSKKIKVTYEAAEPPLPQAATPLLGVTQPFIMHAGSPFPHKNIERLIEAFELLRDRMPELQLVLVGKREYYFEQVEKYAAGRRASSQIIFTGFIPDGQLKWLYQNASAYVLPSLSEGFGLPGLEAMVHGCPLVSSKLTCLPEIYGDAAHYFDPYDAQDMADRINDVLSGQELRQRLIERGRDQVQKYSWQRMAQQTLVAYRSVVADNPVS
jgi:glycosyltransferase involved in cell wall biosynthesis